MIKAGHVPIDCKCLNHESKHKCKYKETHMYTYKDGTADSNGQSDVPKMAAAFKCKVLSVIQLTSRKSLSITPAIESCILCFAGFALKP